MFQSLGDIALLGDDIVGYLPCVNSIGACDSWYFRTQALGRAAHTRQVKG